MRTFLFVIFILGALGVLAILGLVIYELISKNYKYKIKNLFKIITILIIIVFISGGIDIVLESYGPTQQELYINSMQKIVKEKGNINIKCDKENNTIVLSDKNFCVSNGSLDQYLDECANGNKDIESVKKLKQSYINLCNSILKAQSKFYDVKMDVIVKCIEKNSKKDMFIIKNGTLEYNILDNVEKLKAEKKSNDQDTIVKQEDLLNKTLENITYKYKSRFGEVLEANKLGEKLTIKFKISPSYSNKATIHQNGFNMEDLILNQGGDQFDEINYWAVADMEDGAENKVISFTLDKNLINAVKNRNIVGNQIVEKAKDVWILPSLKK